MIAGTVRRRDVSLKDELAGAPSRDRLGFRIFATTSLPFDRLNQAALEVYFRIPTEILPGGSCIRATSAHDIPFPFRDAGDGALGTAQVSNHCRE
jgi:hypothetical protein